MYLEFLGPFLELQKKYIESISEFSEKLNENNTVTFPLKLENSQDFIEKTIKDNIHTFSIPNKIEYFDPFNLMETKMLKLTQTISSCLSKISLYESYNNIEMISIKNDLTKVNEVIKHSPELILYLYLMKYINENYILKNETFHEDKKIIKILMNKKELPNKHDIRDGLDYLDKNYNFSVKEVNEKDNDKKEYNDFLLQLIYYSLEGKLYQAQNFCMLRKEEDMKEIIGGGMASFDIDLEEEIKDYSIPLLDTDLFPPYMKTQHLNDISCKVNKNKNIMDLDNNNNIDDNNSYYGNSHWLLWLNNMYQIVDNVNKGKFNKSEIKINEYEILLFRILCGNKDNFKLSSGNIYEYLYINILYLFNSKLMYLLKQNDNNIKYEFTDENYLDNSLKLYETYENKNKGISIFTLIEEIKSGDEFKVIKKKYPFIDLELSLIQLFSYIIYYNNIAIDEIEKEGYKKNILDTLNNYMNNCKEYIDKYENHIITQMIVEEYQKDNIKSENNEKLLDMKIKSLKATIKLSLSRMIFTINLVLFNISPMKEYICEINNQNPEYEFPKEIFDEILTKLINSILYIIPKRADIENIAKLEKKSNNEDNKNKEKIDFEKIYNIVNINSFIQYFYPLFNFFTKTQNLLCTLKDISLIYRSENCFLCFVENLEKIYKNINIEDNRKNVNLMSEISDIIMKNNNNDFIKKMNNRRIYSIDQGMEKYIKESLIKHPIQISQEIRYNIDNLKLLANTSKKIGLEYMFKYMIQFIDNYMFPESEYLFNNFKDIILEDFRTNENEIIEKAIKYIKEIGDKYKIINNNNDNNVNNNDNDDNNIDNSNINNDNIANDNKIEIESDNNNNDNMIIDIDIDEMNDKLSCILIAFFILIENTFNNYYQLLKDKISDRKNMFDLVKISSSDLINDWFLKLSFFLTSLIKNNITDILYGNNILITNDEIVILNKLIKEWLKQMIKWTRDIYKSNEPIDRSESYKKMMICKLLGVEVIDIGDIEKKNIKNEEGILKLYVINNRKEIIAYINEIISSR